MAGRLSDVPLSRAWDGPCPGSENFLRLTFIDLAELTGSPLQPRRAYSAGAQKHQKGY